MYIARLVNEYSQMYPVSFFGIICIFFLAVIWYTRLPKMSGRHDFSAAEKNEFERDSLKTSEPPTSEGEIDDRTHTVFTD